VKRKQFVYTGCFAVLALGVLLSSCRGKEENAKALPTVGFVMKTLNNPFFVDMRSGAEDAANREGVQLLLQASEREMDAERQLQIIENFVERKVSVICIAPHGAKEAVPAVVKANRAGIPVIVVDSRVDERALAESGGRIASFVGSDNMQGGRLAGEYLARRLGGKGSVAVLEGPAGDETGDSRLAGFRQALAQTPGMRIVSSQTAAFERSQGYVVFQNILQAHPEVAGVFACNDLMALGAVEAISAAGRGGTIIVVGFDAIDDALDAIQKGSMHATIAQYPRRMGETAVQLAARLVRGESVPAEMPIAISLVTKDSLIARGAAPGRMK
jgi:ribose transport system substrate-binding protein